MAKQYLDKDGVQQVWNAVDSKFMRSSGTATRPTYNGNDLALYSDIPSTAKNLYMHNISFSASEFYGNKVTICTQVVCSRQTAFPNIHEIGEQTNFQLLMCSGSIYNSTESAVGSASALYWAADKTISDKFQVYFSKDGLKYGIWVWNTVVLTDFIDSFYQIA